MFFILIPTFYVTDVNISHPPLLPPPPPPPDFKRTEPWNKFWSLLEPFQ